MKMTVGVDTAMIPEFELEYMSVNGYSGKLYGKANCPSTLRTGGRSCTRACGRSTRRKNCG